MEKVLYSFTGGSDGAYPNSLTSDGHGNLFGAADGDASGTGNGAIFELTPGQGGAWNFALQYAFTSGEAASAH